MSDTARNLTDDAAHTFDRTFPGFRRVVRTVDPLGTPRDSEPTAPTGKRFGAAPAKSPKSATKGKW